MLNFCIGVVVTLLCVYGYSLYKKGPKSAAPTTPAAGGGNPANKA